ncbi:MAG: HAMP domain-containing protein [Chloroflexi bacterium]|nr:MAG: HAMP domain-containing protein [Chloroflexota bacterium]
MGNSVTAHRSSSPTARAGMRGGLGRTLLSAFLILAIVPLSAVSFLASVQGRRNLERELRERLTAVTTLREQQIQDWVDAQQQVFAILCSEPILIEAAEALTNPSSNPEARTVMRQRFLQIINQYPDFERLLFLSPEEGRVLVASEEQEEGRRYNDAALVTKGSAGPYTYIAPGTDSGAPALVLIRPVRDGAHQRLGTLVAYLRLEALSRVLAESAGLGSTGRTYLVLPSGEILTQEGFLADQDEQLAIRNPAVEAALQGRSGIATYKNEAGVLVIGVHRWLPDLEIALITEQAQSEAFSRSDDLAAALIATALGAALLTALIATVVTRQITRPIVRLTEMAVQIASGDLDQRVPATRRDEIGILARAFNIMTARLQVLYESLEQKVAERTRQLQEANAEIRYQAIQLATSAEVGRIVTSILDLESLLPQVVELIRDAFSAYHVSLFLIDEEGEWALLREGTGALGERLKREGYRLPVDESNLVGRAISRREPCLAVGEDRQALADTETFPYTRAELTIPLVVRDRPIGALSVHSLEEDAFAGSEVMVLRTLAGQVAIAIENARAYAVEREAAEQLRELDRFKTRFLANMSHELREPLNTIIGFSRVLLKGIDGPLNEIQRQDVSFIHDAGQHLLGLIDDILDIAAIEAGKMELTIREVNLRGLLQSVLATANALVRGRPIELRHEIAPDLPVVQADPQRLRQVILKLLSNAAQFTDEGSITLRAWSEDEQVFISVSDTGIGIPEADRDRIFEQFQRLDGKDLPHPRGVGLGLALSKEFVEMHGGQIWVESSVGQGSTFTFSLPIRPPRAEGRAVADGIQRDGVAL